MSTERLSDEGIGESERSADGPVPQTRAPESGSPPAAGRVSPAEKSEPAGVPLQAQRHNPDPNAPQSEVVPPGSSELPESGTGGVPLSSLRREPDLGSDEARERAQPPSPPPPEDAAEGTSVQDNDPNALPRADGNDKVLR